MAKWPADRRQAEEYRSRIRGCLLGGAIGDALGAPVEFVNVAQILQDHGDDGVRTFVRLPDGAPPGTVTDDTQMTLFTVYGLIGAGIRRDRGLGLTIGMVHWAYDLWLETQLRPEPPQDAGWLLRQPWLWVQRAPGRTCLDALHAARAGAPRIRQYGGMADNDSKGCGGVMRVAPIGLLPPWGAPPTWYYDAAADAAGYTHGHPTGQAAAGALAVIVHRLVAGDDLDSALDVAIQTLAQRKDHDETTTALLAARHLAAAGPPTVAAVESLGGGWVAEEALAIAVYAALTSPGQHEMLQALSIAVTHSGDSDSTGSICGNILGAWHGETALPPELAFKVEGRGTILELADDFALEFTQERRLHGERGPDTGWVERQYGG
jgi:ADP-ribosylglycohydrolase